MIKKILVVAAHADDEVLGCGGTIAKHVACGDIVHVAIMTDGVSSRIGATQADIDARECSKRQAQVALGVTNLYQLNYPDNRMDSLPLLDIVQPLENIISNFLPEIIYTHYHSDLNIDHRVTHQAVMTACRPLPGSSVREIYGFEILSSSEWATPSFEVFKPNMFVAIGDYNSAKKLALNAYRSEMRKVPHTRSEAHVDLVEKHRGYTVGLGAAEAFEVYRVIRD